MNSLEGFQDDLFKSWLFVATSEEEDKDWVLVNQDNNEQPIDLGKSVTGEWFVVDNKEKDPRKSELSQEFISNTIQNILLKLCLREAVFGEQNLLSGKNYSNHPLSQFATLCLNTYDKYLKATSYEKVSIPFCDEYTSTFLNGKLFSGYDKNGKEKSFEPNNTTALLLSGSHAPQETFMTGIIEGYRKKGIQVLAFNYLGFGDNSEIAQPSPANVMLSAEAAITFLINTGIPPHKIIVHGYSLGGYPGTQLAKKFKTHIVLDRVAISIEEVAYSILQNSFSQNMAGKIGAILCSKLAMFGTPFSIQDISQIEGKIFVAQEKNIETEKIGALPFIQKLINDKVISSENVTSHWISGDHLTYPWNTWNVNGFKLAKKLNILLSSVDNNKIARRAWKKFVKSI